MRSRVSPRRPMKSWVSTRTSVVPRRGWAWPATGTAIENDDPSLTQRLRSSGANERRDSCGAGRRRGGDRERDRRDKAARSIRYQRQPCPRAVQRREAAADVGKADATAGRFDKTPTVIGHADAQRGIYRDGTDANRATFGKRAQPVLDGILDQRDQHHGRECL